jgi:hypothetical protein
LKQVAQHFERGIYTFEPHFTAPDIAKAAFARDDVLLGGDRC